MDTQAVSFSMVTIVFILTSNLMLIYGFYKTSRSLTIVTKLFIYLSKTDITFILVMVVLFFVKKSGLNPRLFNALTNGLLYSIFIMDMLIFWTISFLRFLSIYKPMHRVKTRRIHIALLVDFLISFLAANTIFWTFNSITSARVQSINFVLAIIILFGAILMNLALHVASLIILRRSTSSKANQKGHNVLRNQSVIKRNKKALNTLLLITVVQLFCLIPLPLMVIISGIWKINTKFNVFGFCQCLQASSFGFNSLIVILRTKNLREFYRKKFCCFPRINESLENQSATELSTIYEM